MKIPALIAAELRRLTSTRMSVIALIALMLVPVLYGGLYLWANQDPYGRFGDIPVALINDDAGVAASADEPAANYGDRISEDLLDGAAFDWRPMSREAAADALRRGPRQAPQQPQHAAKAEPEPGRQHRQRRRQGR